MLENVHPREDLRPLCRRKFSSTESRTVSEEAAENFANDNWQVVRKRKNSVTIERAKPHNEQLEDRVWSLFYRMGFHSISGDTGARLTTPVDEGEGLSNQIDCVGIDDEVAVAVECKSSKEIGKRNRLQDEIAKLAAIRGAFAKAARSFDAENLKKTAVTCMFLHNAIITENDLSRAKEGQVVLFDDNDLRYYEDLVFHLGSAARYQFLADLLPGKEIPGLKLRLPAIRLKIAGGDAYMFSISPEFLLKISYVSHRQKGRGSDIDTYQRMMRRSRLKRIREFIEAKGVFPTNIVVNFESKRLQFSRTKQEDHADVDTESGLLGWLDIRPAYKSAWIIDGQHRLFGYSGTSRAAKSRLAVLAFSGLKASDQAGMFININSKQKSVKQSLLQELYAELHWDAEDPRMRVRAVVSKVIQSLNEDKSSSFYGRIQAADVARDERRCISLTSVKGGPIVQRVPVE